MVLVCGTLISHGQLVVAVERQVVMGQSFQWQLGLREG